MGEGAFPESTGAHSFDRFSDDHDGRVNAAYIGESFALVTCS